MQHLDHFLTATESGKRYENILENLALEVEKRDIQRSSCFETHRLKVFFFNRKEEEKERCTLFLKR